MLLCATVLAVLAILACGSTTTLAQEQRIILKNGLEYEGRFFTLLEFNTIYGKTKEDPSALNSIAVVDDGLRRIYFNRRHIAAEPIPVNRPNPTIQIWQQRTNGQPEDWRYGQLTYADRFNEFGRRMIASNGRQKFIQGIVEVNARYVKAVALEDPDWISPIATATIPSDVLIPMLRRQVRDSNNITERLRIVDLLMVAKRYRDADAELLSIQKAFPDLAQEYKDFRTRMNAEFANQVVSEIRMRLEHGQVKIAQDLLGAFLGKEGADVSTLVLSEIADINNSISGQLQAVEDARRALLAQWEVARVEEGIPQGTESALANIVEEILRDLRPTNLERLATFVRLASDSEQTALQRVAYAVSGWISGSGAATNSIAAALSMHSSRELAAEYLTNADEARRAGILGELTQLETGETSQMAKILLNMLPPLAPESLENGGAPLAFSLTLPPKANETEGRSVEYLVRLPPQYDPYRRYPCLVCLHPQGRDPEQALYFWTGGFNPRLESTTGYAARHGYIVIAPRWSLPGEYGYRYTAEEQLVVLKSLRDAMRRFSIDSDRVFLAGHFAGGDAAWDIGLSFPDVWAGVIPISAYCGSRGGYPFRCYKTASRLNLPLYFVSGQYDLALEGVEVGRIGFNALSWTPMLAASAGRDLPNFDVTVVEYQKRLAEMFDEELPQIFEWMGRHTRNFAAEEFEVSAMRPWQRQFWWWEVPEVPADKLVLPHEWPPQRGKVDPLQFVGKFDRARNRFSVQNCPGRQATLYLSPDLVDFSSKVSISYAGSHNVDVQPSTPFLLEDVRQRADRQHPFWAAIELQNNKWQAR